MEFHAVHALRCEFDSLTQSEADKELFFVLNSAVAFDHHGLARFHPIHVIGRFVHIAGTKLAIIGMGVHSEPNIRM